MRAHPACTRSGTTFSIALSASGASSKISSPPSQMTREPNAVCSSSDARLLCLREMFASALDQVSKRPAPCASEWTEKQKDSTHPEDASQESFAPRSFAN